MKKQLTILLVLVSVMFSCSVLAEQAHADTNVSGIIDTDTTWTLSNSPYVITNTVQIPSDVTLIIEPGVTINKPTDGDMFLLSGTIYAHGTVDNEIIFDGGSNSNFFRTTGVTGNASLDYCKVQNGYSFWNRGGYFNLKHSELINIDDTHLESPSGDTYIEYNKFINTGGVSVYQAAGRNYKVYVRYNLFQNTSSIHNHGGCPGQNEMIVNYNSFINNKSESMLSLSPNFDTTIMNAANNYWDTQDIGVIDSMIYDKNDDITIENYINYLPILTEPHPDTPTFTICASWTYSNWSECVNEQQTRTIISSSPVGCVSGDPVLSQSCSVTPPICTSWVYSKWSSCENGQQTRTIISSSSENCLEGNPILSQSCQIETDNEDDTDTTTQPKTEAITQPKPETSESNSEEISTTIIFDGDIIQCQSSSNPSAVYIVKIIGDTKYIRHIVSLEIFNYYGHLKWKNLKQVESLNDYSMSGWVRYNTGPNSTAGPTDKVYEINGDQTKHWINMTAEDFLTHGGSEPAIFNINQGELNLYTAGPSVISL